MSDNTPHTNGEGGQTSTYNVISVAFEADANAYAALTALKELDSQGQLNLEAAAVVVRDADGKLVVKDQAGSNEYEGTAVGGLLGLLIGILGGPLGVLIGGTYGLMVGSLFDLDDVEHSESVLGELSASVPSGRTALLAQVTEQSPEVVDSAMARLGGTVLRRPVADVEAEIAAAEKAQRKAKREATKELVHSRHEHNKEHVRAAVDRLKEKVPHHEQAASDHS
ncbi:MAG TPA: DUF1269 domain-containing protein [Solirubrobacteraceae bacterium]|nr:DUF1269 domain-containing protein [Solirubrobacteraceae bacterium]